MSEKLSVISKNYSTALFNLALQQNILLQIKEQLQQLSVALTPNLLNLIKNPTITKSNLKKIAQSLVSKTKFHPIVANFLFTLTINRRLYLLPQINKQFEILFNKNQHILQVQVVSAFGDVNLESIKNILSKKYQQQKFALTQIKNPQILGGLQINIENTVVDISLKNNLLQIQKHLINSLN